MARDMEAETKEIEGFTCFMCPQTDCWITEHGCKINRKAADNAAHSILSEMTLNKINDASLKRLSECCACFRYNTISEAAFIQFIKDDIDKGFNLLFSEDSIAWEGSEYETRRIQWKNWYYKHLKKEGK